MLDQNVKAFYKKAFHRSFTLLELVIGMMLLTAISAPIAYNVHQGIQKKRFSSTCATIEKALDTAWSLARLTNTDATVMIQRKEDRYVVFLKPAFIPPAQAALFAKKTSLEGIKEIDLTVTSEDCFVNKNETGIQIMLFPEGVGAEDGTITITPILQQLNPYVINLNTYKRTVPETAPVIPEKVTKYLQEK